MRSSAAQLVTKTLSQSPAKVLCSESSEPIEWVRNTSFASATKESLILWSPDGEKWAHVLHVLFSHAHTSQWAWLMCRDLIGGRGGVFKGAGQRRCSCSGSSARLSLSAHGLLPPFWILRAVFWYSPQAEVSVRPFCTRNCGLTWWVRLLPMTPYGQVTADWTQRKKTKVRFISTFCFYFPGIVNGALLVTKVDCAWESPDLLKRWLVWAGKGGGGAAAGEPAFLTRSQVKHMVLVHRPPFE